MGLGLPHHHLSVGRLMAYLPVKLSLAGANSFFPVASIMTSHDWDRATLRSLQLAILSFRIEHGHTSVVDSTPVRSFIFSTRHAHLGAHYIRTVHVLTVNPTPRQILS